MKVLADTTSQQPAGNGTQMQALPETGEQFNGYTLMVEAYAAIWLILMAWIVLLWRKQASLTTRVAGLEATLDRAEKRMVKDFPPKRSAAQKTIDENADAEKKAAAEATSEN